MDKSFRAGDVMFGVFYPHRYILAVFEEEETAIEAQAALAGEIALEDAGRIWSGEEALEYHRHLREDHRSLIERLAALLAHDEAEALESYLGMARAGAVFLTVHVEGEETIDAAQHMLARHGGHSMRYYGDWTVRHLSSDVMPQPAHPATSQR